MIWAAKPQGIWRSSRKSERWIFGRFEKPLLHRILVQPYFMLLNPNHVEGFEACHVFSSSYTDSRAVNFCVREDERVQSLEMVLHTLKLWFPLWTWGKVACSMMHFHFTLTSGFCLFLINWSSYPLEFTQGSQLLFEFPLTRDAVKRRICQEWQDIDMVFSQFSHMSVFFCPYLFCSGLRNRVACRMVEVPIFFRGSGRHQQPLEQAIRLQSV